MNRGNAGQRYAMTKLVSVEPQDKHVMLHLACGHYQTTTPRWGTLEQLVDICRARIGKRQRCDECKPRLEAKQ